MSVELVSSTPWMGDLTIRCHRLANGLRVLLVADHSAPVFAFNGWYGVGSRDEVDGRTGLAHLFEHLMFKATTSREEGEFDRLMEEAGASTNAGTYMDWTFYHQALKVEHLDLCLELEADRMRNLALDEEMLRTEREVVRNERLLSTENDPEGRMNELLHEAAYTRHPYRWPIIGKKPDLDAIGLEDCRSFYRTWYSPENAVLVLVGALDEAATLASVERWFGAIPRGGRPETVLPVEPPQHGERRVELELPISSEMFVAAFHVPRYTHDDLPAVEVLASVLFDGPSSRVERRLVSELQIATGVDSSVANTKDPGLWEIGITTREGVPAWQAEVVLYEELERISREWVAETELAKAKARLEAGFLRTLRDASEKAFQLGFHEIVTGDHRFLVGLLDKYRRVTREDVRRVAQAYLGRDNRTVVLARPKDAGRASRAVGSRTRRELAGGDLVLVETSHDLPMVWVRAVLRTGCVADPEGKAGLGNLTGEMLLRGTRNHPRDEFEEALDRLGANLSVRTGRLTTTLAGEVPSWNLDPFLRLLGDALTAPAFDAGELEKLQEQIASEILETRNDDGSLVGWFLRDRMLPGSPYGRDVRGTGDSIRGISLEDVWKHYARMVGRGQLVVAAAGDLDPGTFESRVRPWLDGLEPSGEGAPVVEPPARFPPGRRLILVDKPDRSQLQYAIGTRAIEAASPDWIAMLVAETAFGGTFTSTLMQELREKRGWTYGVYSQNPRTRFPDVYSMVAYPTDEDGPRCLRTHLDLYRAYCRGELTDERIEAARSYLANRFPFLLDTVVKRLDRNLENEFLEAPRDYWERYVDAVRSVPAEEVRAAVMRCRQDQDLTVAVVCTASGMQARLESEGLEFESVETADWQEVR